MKCPELLRDRETGSCSHSKLLAVTTTAVSALTLLYTNIAGNSAIIGWEGWVGLNIACLANAQMSKFLGKPPDVVDTEAK